ncbi:phosphdiesterase [Gregarina niphandrodes]|uniref:Phosphodiesterase n=1 Tax=Gregarina niphandrodes TaxID=110365 RepID=A0A023B6P2_GRENI|nr:phosphdiesterase [Gregarina niphandrodes]EZG66653.1 phosphdiesterase [Gregarina niphandrodes]|eukprot:XP_011130547.1 phosphdiesterase [Gregarina niphandrodes]
MSETHQDNASQDGGGSLEKSTDRSVVRMKTSISRAPSMTSASSVDVQATGCNPLYFIFHPGQVPREVFRSVAANRWIECRKAIQLFPLRFRDAKEEVEYKSLLNEDHSVMPHLAAGNTLFILFVLIVTAIGFDYPRHAWFIAHKMGATLYLGFVAMLISILGNVYLYFQIQLEVQIKWIRTHRELNYYIVNIISIVALQMWGLALTIHANEIEPLDFNNPLGNQDVLHVKMWVDGLANATMLLPIVQCDMFLNTLSRWSIYFHLFVLCSYLANRMGTLGSLSARALVAGNILDLVAFTVLYLFGWAARWYRELQHRASVVNVKQSQQSLQRVLQHKSKKRRTQSAAEELIGIFTTCQQILEDRGRTEREAIKLLQDCQKQLSQDQQAEETGGVVGTDEAADPMKLAEDVDEDMQENAFMNMYRVAKRRQGADTAKAAAERRTGARKTSAVRFGTTTSERAYHAEEAPSRVGEIATVTIGGVTLPSLTIQEELKSVVGADTQWSVIQCSNTCVSPFMEVAWSLTESLLPFFDVKPEVLLGTLYIISKLYWAQNPYHSPEHAAQVAHSASAFVHTMDVKKFLTELDLAALILGALGHDVGHPGRTNNYYVQANSMIALASNDTSTLESTHNFLLQRIIGHLPEVHLFVNLTADENRSIRKMMQQLILITDMGKHFDFISRLRLRRSNPDFDMMLNESDKLLAMQLAVKAGDISHVGMGWDNHEAWTTRLVYENMQQGDDEAKRNMMISPLCDRESTDNFSATQAGFVNFIALPLFQELAEIDPTGNIASVVLANVQTNKARWDTRGRPSFDKDPKKKIAPPVFPMACIKVLLTATTFKALAMEEEETAETAAQPATKLTTVEPETAKAETAAEPAEEEQAEEE